MNRLTRFFGIPFHRPLARTIDLGAPEIARNPFPWYERLRSDGPVQFLARHDAWIVLGYDEVQSVLTSAHEFSSRPHAHIDDVLLAAEPAEHAPIRRIVAQSFTSDAIERLGAFADAYARELLRPRMDLVRDYAMPLSAAVAAQLLGVDDDDLATIRAARDGAPVPSDTFLGVIDRIAAKTAIYVRLTGEGLDDTHARSLFRLLWLAATSTTERAIASCALRLLQHPEARELRPLRAFIGEVLRLHPPELIVLRNTTRSVLLAGAPIPSNADIYVCVAAANRDPSRFERASDLLLYRPAARIFTFGAGIHHCVGATLGRRVIESAIRAILVHAPSVRATQPLEDVIDWSSKTSSPVARLLVECDG